MITPVSSQTGPGMARALTKLWNQLTETRNDLGVCAHADEFCAILYNVQQKIRDEVLASSCMEFDPIISDEIIGYVENLVDFNKYKCVKPDCPDVENHVDFNKYEDEEFHKY